MVTRTLENVGRNRDQPAVKVASGHEWSFGGTVRLPGRAGGQVHGELGPGVCGVGLGPSKV